MAKIITFANQKGGVGKTTTTHVVSIGLAKRGYKVLACDLDAQANLTSVFGIDSDKVLSVYDLFEGMCKIEDAIIKTDSGVDLLAGSLMLSSADRRYGKPGDNYKLKEALENVKNNYDFIILDTPPALGCMSLNALVATNYLIVVMTPDYFSGKGLKLFEQTVKEVIQYLNNPNLKINGLLLTRCDRTNLSSVIDEELESVAKILNTKIYKSRIRQGVAVRESQYLESSLFDMKNTPVLNDYNNFIDEILAELAEV